MKKTKNNLLKFIISIITIIIASILIYNRTIIKPNENVIENTIEESIVEEDITEESISESTLSDGSYDEELDLESEGFEESNPEMISGSTQNNELIVIGNSKVLGKPIYYSQRDSRWRNILYTSTGNKSQTIGSSGCGPTSAAMIIAGLKDSSMTPVKMADLFVKNGFRSANVGTYSSAFKWIADKYGIEYKQVYSVNDAIQEVRNGNFVITSCAKGLFASGGHYIVMTGIDENTLKIYDPYLYSGKFNISSRKGKVTVSGTTVNCSVNNFKNYANSTRWFVFIKDKTPEKLFNQGQTVLINERVAIAYDGGTNLLLDNGLNQFWLNRSVVTSDSRIYGLATVVWEEGDRILVQLFDSQFWVNKTSLSAQIPGSDNKTTENKSTPAVQPNNSNYVLGKYKTNTNLNVRRGPSTNYKIIKTYTKNTRFDTSEINGVWARTPSGWVNLKYCTLINKY